MRRTYVCFISVLIISIANLAHAQDSILFPLKIKAGIEVSGPVIYLQDKNNLSTEGYVSVDLNEKKSVVLGGGYLNYKYSQYNYDYLTKGFYIRAGMDFNLLQPEISIGKYWAGIGLRYGLSMFNSETPSFKKENYWGTVTSSIASRTNWGHFIEASPGFRTELFRNFSIGWSVSLRILLYTGTGKDLRPIYIPGFGNGGKTFSAGISYFMVWSIPYKTIIARIKKEEPESTEEPVNPNQTGSTSNTVTSVNR